jgi:hypothetical protein
LVADHLPSAAATGDCPFCSTTFSRKLLCYSGCFVLFVSFCCCTKDFWISWCDAKLFDNVWIIKVRRIMIHSCLLWLYYSLKTCTQFLLWLCSNSDNSTMLLTSAPYIGLLTYTCYYTVGNWLCSQIGNHTKAYLSNLAATSTLTSYLHSGNLIKCGLGLSLKSSNQAPHMISNDNKPNVE